METTQFVVRVRRGSLEVEVRGSEDFVREMSAELLEIHLTDDDASEWREPISEFGIAAGRQRPDSQPSLTRNPLFPPLAATYRDMLTTARGASAAEKVLLAGYFLMSEGKESFDAASAGDLFESAYETKPNFSRELERAAREGWLMRARGSDSRRLSFVLTHRGAEQVRQLLKIQEGV